MLFERQKLIYGGFVDGIFDISDMHTSETEEEFSEKHRDDDDNGDYDYYYDDEFITLEKVTPRDMYALESQDFAAQRRVQQGKALKILTPNQPISLAHLKAGNNSEELKNEFRQFVQIKKTNKKVFKSLINIFLNMETIFMNTENSKTIEAYRLRLNLADKPNLKDPNKNMDLAHLSIYYKRKNIKSEYNNSKIKISAPTWNDQFDLAMNLIQFQIFKIILNLSTRNMRL